MKLPGIQKGGTQRLVRQDVNSPLAEANARSAAFGAIGGVAAGALLAYEDRETKRQEQEATLNVMKDMISVEERYGSKLEFNIMDQEAIDDPNITDALTKVGVEELDSVVPAYRIMPEIRAKSLADSIAKHGATISKNSSREDWTFDYEKFGLKQYLGDTVQAGKDQIAYIDFQTVKEMDKALEKGDHDLALLVVNTSQLQPERMAKLTRDITTDKQKTRYNEVIEASMAIDEMNPAQLVAQVDVLREYRKELNSNVPEHTSHLTSDNQKSLSASITGRINAIRRVTEKVEKEDLTFVKYRADQYSALAKKGKLTDTTDAINIMNRLLKSEESADKVRGLKLGLDLQSADQVISYDAGTSDERAGTKRLMERLLNVATTNPDDATVALNSLESMNNSDREMAADGVKWARDRGVFPIPKFNPQTPVESFRQRIGVMDYFENSQGMPNVAFSKQENGEMATAMQSMDSTQLTALWASAVDAADGDINVASSIFSGMKDQELGVVYAQAAQRGIQGDLIGAVKAVQGQRLLDDPKNSGIVSEVRPKMRTYLTKNMGNIYPYNTTEQNAVQHTSLAVYAQLSHDAGDWSGKYDKTRMEQAVSMATGGILEYEGVKFGTPLPGMSQKAFDFHMDDLPVAAWSDAVGNPNETERGVKSGDLKLLPSGHNKFYLRDRHTGKILPSKSDPRKPFVFSVESRMDMLSKKATLVDRANDVLKRKANLLKAKEWKEMEAEYPELSGQIMQDVQNGEPAPTPEWLKKTLDGVKSAGKWLGTQAKDYGMDIGE